MKIVLFLGAGFSRPFGLPVMREFFDQVNSSDRIGNEDKDFIRDLRQRARHGAGMIQGSNDNLEHVLSFALMNPATRRTNGTDLSAADRLRNVLLRIYTNLKLTTARQMATSFARLLQREPGLRWDHQLTVITTNYDLLAEFGLRVIDLTARLPFDWKQTDDRPSQGRLYSRDPASPVMCKIHGSLNFFPKEDNSLQIEDRVVNVFSAMHSEQSSTLPLMCASNYFKDYKQPGVPLLIPPTLYKQQGESVLIASWDAASEAIAVADRIAIIGYSFSTSDTYMKYFFSSALVSNIDLPRIDIVDPLAEKIIERLKASDYGEHLKERLRPVNEGWTQANYSIVK